MKTRYPVFRSALKRDTTRSPRSRAAVVVAATVHMQISESQFASEAIGHRFVLRRPLAKATATRCAECGSHWTAHSRAEVDDGDVLSILNVVDECKPSDILSGRLFVGGCMAVLSHAHTNPFVVNCAGKQLHSFLPKTRSAFDALKAQGRCYDLEWEDSEGFTLGIDEIVHAIRWVDDKIKRGCRVIINCAQGKSRSGTLAIAYLMARDQLDVKAALTAAQARRPLIQPNPGFLRQLSQLESSIKASLNVAAEQSSAICDPVSSVSGDPDPDS